MEKDIVDELLDQWAIERPRMNVSSLGIVVRVQMLGKLLQQRTSDALRRHGLKHWEYDVLSVLRRQGGKCELPATEIARAALLTTGAMTTRIDRLVERGLVQRRKTTADRRSVLVRLTQKGKQLVNAAIDSRLEDANQALAKIPLAERRRMAANLRHLLLNIES
jgi:DNA-binding MarR family transcriptional regulator